MENSYYFDDKIFVNIVYGVNKTGIDNISFFLIHTLSRPLIANAAMRDEFVFVRVREIRVLRWREWNFHQFFFFFVWFS